MLGQSPRQHRASCSSHGLAFTDGHDLFLVTPLLDDNEALLGALVANLLDLVGDIGEVTLSGQIQVLNNFTIGVLNLQLTGGLVAKASHFGL